MDIAISKWFYNNISQNGFLNQIAKFLSLINEFGQMWIVLILGLLVYESIKNKKFKTYLLIATIAMTLVWVLSDYVVKALIFKRPRPGIEIKEFIDLCASINYKYPSSYSFPSGHSLYAIGSATIIAKKFPKVAIPAYVLGALVCVSRIVLGCHYFSDVIVGAIVGLGAGLLGCFLAEKLEMIIERKFSK